MRARSRNAVLGIAACFAFLVGCTETYIVQPAQARSVSTADASRVRVYPKGSAPDQRAEVVGVLDFHSAAESEDKGFDELRAHAAQLGADAVIDAEFEHGEGSEPSHLSGMAVRFVSYDVPPYEELGVIDVETPEDADDKGFATMQARASAMGADRIIEVRFEHGAEGGSSHLRGKAVRYRRRS